MLHAYHHAATHCDSLQLLPDGARKEQMHSKYICTYQKQDGQGKEEKAEAFGGKL